MKSSIIQKHTSSNLFRAVLFIICIISYLKSNAQQVPLDIETMSGGRVLVSNRIQMLGVLYKEYIELGKLLVVDEERVKNYRRMLEFLYENRPTPKGMGWARFLSVDEAALATNLNKVEWLIKNLHELQVKSPDHVPKVGDTTFRLAQDVLDRLPTDLQGRIQKQYAQFQLSNSKPDKIKELRLRVKTKIPRGIAGTLALVAAGYATAGEDEAETKSTVGAGAGSKAGSKSDRVTVDDDDFGPIAEKGATVKAVRSAQ